MWAGLEREIAGGLGIKIRGKDDLRLDALIRFDFVEPNNEEELQLDREC